MGIEHFTDYPQYVLEAQARWEVARKAVVLREFGFTYEEIRKRLKQPSADHVLQIVASYRAKLMTGSHGPCSDWIEDLWEFSDATRKRHRASKHFKIAREWALENS